MSAKADVFTRNEQKIETVTPSLRALTRRAVKAALEYEKVSFVPEVSVTYTDNEGIRELNAAHRNIDRATDVLSFPLFENEELAEASDGDALGDIVISLEKAREQANEYGHSFEREVAFLTVHSMLHLLGYDHEISEADEKEMFFRQEEILKTMGLLR
ncbi:MAG: rRNA maturation RNase YbeY [Ruminococcaceae bacterium]|nr:rRNA maturation RNase YbeY [Oscillospiraceae bacterium]